jgi:hypothetical protein
LDSIYGGEMGLDALAEGVVYEVGFVAVGIDGLDFVLFGIVGVVDGTCEAISSLFSDLDEAIHAVVGVMGCDLFAKVSMVDLIAEGVVLAGGDLTDGIALLDEVVLLIVGIVEVIDGVVLAIEDLFVYDFAGCGVVKDGLS